MARTTLLLDAPFDSPFYSGAAVVTDSAKVFEIALNGHQYRIDPKQYRRNTLPTLRPPQDNSTEPGEQSLNTESVWRRSTSDWILGAGQSYLDDLSQPQSNRNQFYTSAGVDPWTRRQLSLLHDTRRILTSGNSNLRLLGTPNVLYAAAGSTLKYTANPDTASPSWTTVTVTSDTIEDMTLVGTSVYIALGSGGIRTSGIGTGSSSTFSSYNATKVAFSNGFLIAAKPGDISSVDSGGTATSLFTHFDSSMDWTDIEAAPMGCFVCGNTLGRAEIYFIGLDTSTGALNPPIYAGGLPAGETINQLAYYQGLMLMGTSAGIRLAQVNSANGLDFGPLISVANGVDAFEARGEFLWFSWSNYDATKTGLGRVLLSRNTEPGIPAYATDLMAAAQGVVTSVATFGSKRYFAVASDGFYAEMDDYVSSGTIDSGWIRFGTTERKVATSVDVHHEELPAGSSISIAIVKDDESTITCGTSDATGSLGPPDPFPAQNASGEAMRVQLTMRRGTAHTDTPTLRRWTLRATPTPIRTDEILVPLILRSAVSTHEETGQDIAFDTLAEFTFLKNLESSRQVVSYQEGPSVYSVQVDRVLVRPEKWNAERDYFDGLVFVRLLTVGA